MLKLLHDLLIKFFEINLLQNSPDGSRSAVSGKNASKPLGKRIIFLFGQNKSGRKHLQNILASLPQGLRLLGPVLKLQRLILALDILQSPLLRLLIHGCNDKSGIINNLLELRYG